MKPIKNALKRWEKLSGKQISQDKKINFDFKICKIIIICHIECGSTYELLRPTLLVSDPEMIQEILVSKFKDWSNHRVRSDNSSMRFKYCF